MAAYIDHAAYYVSELDWYVDFFSQVFGMEGTRQRSNCEGLREVWLSGCIQLCETTELQRTDGRTAHLCLIVDDVEASREKALAWGCAPMDKHHWVQLPDGLSLELFYAAEGAIETMTNLVKKR